MKSLLITVSFLLSQEMMASASRIDVADEIIQAFGPSCPRVITSDVQRSLAGLKGLGRVIESLKESESCRSGGDARVQYSLFNNMVENLVARDELESSKYVTERQIMEMTRMLDSGNLTSSQKSYVESKILDRQMDFIEYDAKISRFGRYSSKEARGARNVMMAVDSMLSSWGQNPACFQDKRHLVPSLISNTLLATSQFASPGTALALGGAGFLIGSLQRFFEDYKRNKDQTHFNNQKMPLAIRCASEALTENYCDAEEAINLIETTTYNQRGEVAFESIDLFANHLKSLSHWFEEIHAGSPINSEGDMVNRRKPLEQARLLEDVVMYARAYFNLRSKELSTISNDAQLSDAIAESIEKIVYIMEKPSLTPKKSSGGWSSSKEETVENPIFTVWNKKNLPYLLLFPDLKDFPECRFECSLAGYLREQGIVLTMGHWEESFNRAGKIVADVQEAVNKEKSKVMIVDAYSIMVRATKRLRGESNPLQGLLKIVETGNTVAEYLRDTICVDDQKPQYCEGDNPTIYHDHFQKILSIMRTIKLAKMGLFLIEESAETEEFDYLYGTIKSSQTLKELAKDNLDDYISTSIKWAVKKAIDKFKRKIDKITYDLSEIFGNMIGESKSRQGKLIDMSEEEEAELVAMLEPLDILFEKTPFVLSDKFIPGHWGHVGVWIGKKDDLVRLGIWEHPLVQKYADKIEAGHGIVEALRPGVQINTFRHFLNIDDLVFVRKRIPLTNEQKRRYILNALRQIGKPYDFNFDVESRKELICSEVIYVTYEDDSWPNEKKLGRYTISPDNVAMKAIDDGPFYPYLLYTDGVRYEEGIDEIFKDLLIRSSKLMKIMGVY